MSAPVFQEIILIGLYPTVLCVAIGTDIARRIIPNLLVAALVAGFAAMALVSPLPDLSLRLLVAGAVTSLGFSLFSQDLVGAGDAKFAGALMLWLDPVQLPLFALIAGLIGGGLSLALALRLQRHAGAGPAAPAMEASLPYAVALAGAGLLLHPYSSLMLGA
ncbi:A24 family peptidase [Xanthobacter pseudotagetidis]|uniref:A24 family peptidase n=1 Tax=Xanthobacter pseudotagetidis TaxID=3119911 RepID=UPI0037283E87